jgi:hypothetical protein
MIRASGLETDREAREKAAARARRGEPSRVEDKERRVESRELKVEKFHDRTAIELTHRIIYRSVSSSLRDEAAGASDIILATLQQVTGPAFQKRGKKGVGRRFGFALARSCVAARTIAYRSPFIAL